MQIWNKLGIFFLVGAVALSACSTMELDHNRQETQERISAKARTDEIPDDAKYVFIEIKEDYPENSFQESVCGLPPNRSPWTVEDRRLCREKFNSFYLAQLQYKYFRADFQDVMNHLHSNGAKTVFEMEDSLRRSHNYGVRMHEADQLRKVEEVYNREYSGASQHDTATWVAVMQGLSTGMAQGMAPANPPTFVPPASGPAVFRTPAGSGGGILTCGIKPIPSLGCSIGDCVNGHWEQICNSVVSGCGIQPIPRPGCQIGRCVNGAWEELCGQLVCGIQPIPAIGCRIGKCVNGQWEQVCQ